MQRLGFSSWSELLSPSLVKVFKALLSVAAHKKQYHHDHLVSVEFSSICSSGCSSHGASSISNRAHECYENPALILTQHSLAIGSPPLDFSVVENVSDIIVQVGK
ncbi:hypothetical protein ACFXTH_001427 [Malus domestica]